MDNGDFSHKQPTKTVIGLSRTAINSRNFTLASNTPNGHRYSSIEPSGGGGGNGSCDTRTNGNSYEIRTKHRNAIQRQGNVSIDSYNRWTVNSIDTSTKYYDNKKGINTTTSANDTNNIYSIADKSKWTQKTPINGNISV